MSGDVWVRHPEKPFGTLLSYVGTYLHPEVDDEAYDDLRYLTGKPESEMDKHTRQFKVELRRVIVGDREELPEGVLFRKAFYEDGSEEAFVKRLWTELFPNEPLPSKD